MQILRKLKNRNEIGTYCTYASLQRSPSIVIIITYYNYYCNLYSCWQKSENHKHVVCLFFKGTLPVHNIPRETTTIKQSSQAPPSTKQYSDWTAQTTPNTTALHKPLHWYINPLLQCRGLQTFMQSLSCAHILDCSPPPLRHILLPPKHSQPLSVSGMDGACPLARNTHQHRITYSSWESQVTVPLARMAGCYQQTNIPRGNKHVAHAQALFP